MRLPNNIVLIQIFFIFFIIFFINSTDREKNEKKNSAVVKVSYKIFIEQVVREKTKYYVLPVVETRE